MTINQDTLQWMLACDEPWTVYRTRLDLLEQPPGSPEVIAARAAMLAHPDITHLIQQVSGWPGSVLKRHNDASHLIHKLAALAEFGVRADDPGMPAAIQAILERQSTQGAFQVLLNIPKAFGGSGEDLLTWVLCDAPLLLYALLTLGVPRQPQLQPAVDHLVSLADENGWRCQAAPELGKFKGPGRKSDPCPIANVYALKALSRLPEYQEAPAVRAGAEALLQHWEQRGAKKFFLFGIGSDFHKLKYPFIWYDILHVVDTLSRVPFLHNDPRFQQMLNALLAQADSRDRYTAGSMYLPWKGWSFADKKQPSPWLTLLVLRIQKRVANPTPIQEELP